MVESCGFWKYRFVARVRVSIRERLFIIWRGGGAAGVGRGTAERGIGMDEVEG